MVRQTLIAVLAATAGITLGACGSSGHTPAPHPATQAAATAPPATATPPTPPGKDLSNPAKLDAAVMRALNAKLSDPASEGYKPGVRAMTATCIHASGPEFNCVLNLSDGTGYSYTVTVSADGNHYVAQPTGN